MYYCESEIIKHSHTQYYITLCPGLFIFSIHWAKNGVAGIFLFAFIWLLVMTSRMDEFQRAIYFCSYM